MTKTEIATAEKPNSGGGDAGELEPGPSTRCKRCTTIIQNEELDKNLRVCPHCQFHIRIGARERIHSLVELNSFEELDADMMSVELLHFTGIEAYASRLALNQSATGQKDAIITGIGKIGEHRVCLGALDFGFLGTIFGTRDLVFAGWTLRRGRVSERDTTSDSERAADAIIGTPGCMVRRGRNSISVYGGHGSRFTHSPPTLWVMVGRRPDFDWH